MLFYFCPWINFKRFIENNFGEPHEWWNIHPAKNPDEHQGGIHGKGSPSGKIFTRR
jgi:toxin YxiD